MSGLEIVTVSWLEAAELMYQSGPPLLIVNNSDPNSVGKPIDIRSALAQLRHLQADFDGTLTTGKSHWLLLSKVFPDAAHSASTVLPVVEYDRRLFMEGRPERPELAETNPWAARAVEPHQNLVCVLMRDLSESFKPGCFVRILSGWLVVLRRVVDFMISVSCSIAKRSFLLASIQ